MPNEDMYVQREDLEAALTHALKSDKHIIVHGESGSGKSWLYKRVLTEINAEYLIADMANASRFGSITAAFQDLLDRRERAEKTSYSEEKAAGANVGIIKADIKHTGQFELGSKEPYERCLEYLRKLARKKPAVLVWDNFERLVNDEARVREAADLISLVDNPDYAAYQVKIIIVGVPADLSNYISQVDQANTIANRLTEIPEVARLSLAEATNLIARGFCKELEYEFQGDFLNRLTNHVAWITDRIPQHIHEYCLELANIGDDKGRELDGGDMASADQRWLNSALNQTQALVDGHMNSRRTEAGRRDQTIYAIGACKNHEFNYTEIEAIIRKQFPESTSDRMLNVSQLLQALATGDAPLIKQTPKGTAYRFVNPKIRMCIRTTLKIDPTGNRVEKRKLPN